MAVATVPTSSSTASRHALWLIALVALVSLWRLAVREWLGLELHFDEAQYVVWSYDPAAGYFSKPPMVAWVIFAARAACGESDFCVRLPATLALALATWLVFLTGGRLADGTTALRAALLFLLAPLVSFLAWFITTDSLLLLAWAAALYGFVRALQDGALRWWLFTGAVAGAGLLSKYTMGVFAVSALGFLLAVPAQRAHLRTPGPWAGAVVAALLLAPNLAWNAAHRFATFGHTATISNLSEAALGGAALARGAEFVGAQFGVFGPVAMVALLAAVVALRSRPSSPRPAAAGGDGAAPAAAVMNPAGGVRRQPRRTLPAATLLAWFTLPMLLIITAQAVAARAHANWAAPAYVGGALLAALWIGSRPRRPAQRWFAAAVATNLAIMALLHGYRPLLAALERPLARDPMAQLFGWRAVGQAIEAQLAAEGNARLLVDERRLMSYAIRYGGPRARGALAWNPAGRVEHHYQLLRDVARTPGAAAGPFLLVSAQDRSDELARAFSNVEPRGRLDTGAGGRTVHAWRLGALRPEAR